MSRIKRFFRRRKLEGTMARQPYRCNIKGVELVVHRDVFPPDIGLATKVFIDLLPAYPAQTALDMGAGTGAIALAMKRCGIPLVYAVDNHTPALQCIEENKKLNPAYGDLVVLESNLFARIPKTQTFDLIVFNHPYTPSTSKVIFGNGPEGGVAIVERFLREARNFLNEEGIILMSFSNTFSNIHNPLHAAAAVGYKAKLVQKKSSLLDTVYIYEFRTPCN